MNKKKYTLHIQNIDNPKILSRLLTDFLKCIKEFCNVELITVEKKSFEIKEYKQKYCLDPWL